MKRKLSDSTRRYLIATAVLCAVSWIALLLVFDGVGVNLLDTMKSILFFLSCSVPYIVASRLPGEACVLYCALIIPFWWAVILLPLLGISNATTVRTRRGLVSLQAMLVAIHVGLGAMLVQAIAVFK